MKKGGYEEGYLRCGCFWGRRPAGLVTEAVRFFQKAQDKFALDLGCGEGKNAAAMARSGFYVIGLEISGEALENARRNFSGLRVVWMKGDMTTITFPVRVFDLAVATGSLHCLRSQEEIVSTVTMIQAATRAGGINVVSAFNDGPHNFSGHQDGFDPTLISHETYLGLYDGWEIVEESNRTQADIHPDTQVKHFHSITRIMARRSGE